MLRFSKEEIEKDRIITWKIIRYLLFYLACIVVLSIYSYLFDLIFGSKFNEKKLYYTWLQYVVYYIIAGWIAFPLSFGYNYMINHVISPNYLWRIATGVFSFVLFGFICTRGLKFGYYIGPYRELKNLLALALSGLSIELIRIIVIKIRLYK
jgi:hypothetical protein